MKRLSVANANLGKVLTIWVRMYCHSMSSSTYFGLVDKMYNVACFKCYAYKTNSNSIFNTKSV